MTNGLVNEFDPSTLSNPNEVEVQSFALDLCVNFDSKTLSGSVEITAKVVDQNATVLRLDTRDLSIDAVLTDNVEVPFVISPAQEPFGCALSIPLPKSAQGQKDSIFRTVVKYCTSCNSTAVQWLSPAQTLSGTHPYLFTQCQAIHARSLVPCQDSPMIKSTYTAKISVPAPLVALMSAVGNEVPSQDGTSITYSFEQKVPIPSYLLALAVGLIEKRDIGPRTAVWAEKDVVEKAAYEFEDTEKFLQAAEQICGPYVWGRYDLLCLPPSFPYGGMENPCLTFVTPTLLAGDKSLANVVAHEIAHSWTGNLVTNRSWEHFWLNEGFTVYVERKILGRLHGDPEFHFQAVLGWKKLQDDIDLFGETNKLTNLCPKLSGVDPDDAFSSVPYEKGFNLLFYLENQFGRERFEKFLRDWISKHSLSTVTTTMFVEAVKFEFADLQDELSQVDWSAWLHCPGMPPIKPNFDLTLHEAVTAASEDWLSHDHPNERANVLEWPSTKALLTFTSSQKVAFLDKLLLKRSHLSRGSVDTLIACKPLGIAGSRNAEIRFRFCSVCLAVEHEAVLPDCVEFITQQGRMKFVRPLYRDLFHTKIGKDLAVSTFSAHRQSYHSIAAKMIERDLQLSS